MTSNDKKTKKPPFALAEASALLVGGSSGVGLASAIQLARLGVPRIALMARNPERGAAARQSILEAAPRCQVHFVQGDANNLDQAISAGERARKALGSIEILVNTTTCSFTPELFHRTPLANIRQIIDQLVVPQLHMCGVVIPWMREQGAGAIINVASDAAKSATPGESVIGAGMAAIVMFSRTLAMEAKRDGVRVNVLTPSLIAGTPLTDHVMKDGFSAKLFQKAASIAHLGVPEADDLAGMIAFLAGPQGALVTGQAISINGGISAA